MLIHHELEKQAVWRSTETAVSFEGETYSYAELNERTNRIARALADAGVEEGDRLLVHGLNHVDWYTLYFACSKLGATFCPISRYQPLANLEYISDELGPAAGFYTGGSEIVDERLPVFREHAPDLEYFALDDPVEGDRTLDSLVEGRDGTNPDWRDDHPPEQHHSILWTSGTTGHPKAVVRDHESSLRSVDSLLNVLPFGPDNVRLTTNPMMLMDPYFHYGLSTFMVGGEIVIIREFSPEAACRAVQKAGVNTMTLGFTLSRIFLQYLDEHDETVNLRYLTSVITSANIARELYDITEGLFHIYGSTEVGIPLINLLEPPFEGTPAIGKPTVNADIRLVSDGQSPGEGSETPYEPGDRGEMICRGTTTMTRYLSDEHQRERVSGDWVYTGDVARVNDDGELVFVGRTDDRLRSGGINVYPAEIEDTIEDHAAVADSVVVGVDDEKWGQRVCAVVVPATSRDDRESLANELNEYCCDSPTLTDEMRPKEYAFESKTNDIPTGALGKESREEIRERYFETVEE